MGRKGWGRREKSAIQQAFIECQVRAEHMVSSNRCCEGDKKKWNTHSCPQDEGDGIISTVCLALDLDILTLFSKDVWMKSSDQQPRTCKNPIAAEVCKRVCVRVGNRRDWGRERGRRERVYRYSDGTEGEERVMPCMEGPFLCLLNQLLMQEGFC